MDLAIPPKRKIVEYFRQHAVEQLDVPSAPQPDGQLRFEQTDVDVRPQQSSETEGLFPEMSHLLWTGHQIRDQHERPRLFTCDTRLGGFAECFPGRDESLVQNWMNVGNPAHAEPTDLDQDGQEDVVIADLGSFLPEDHNRGRVLWLHRSGPDEKWEVVELATGLGRVADVQPGDFDGDGDIDLVVAEFGWLKTGHVLLLVNQGRDEDQPRFETTIVDPRHGAIHVPVIDLNKDGRLDFVALISQEHETINAYLNQGDGTFRSEVLFEANDPSFGSSGIQLVDLDGDDDTNILYTNGDMLDSFYLKPYHAIRWIENRGDEEWKGHVLANMPGVMRAIAGDLDDDGDMDVVASSMIPSTAFNRSKESLTLASLIWIEQVESREFKVHVLETDQCHHAALEMADFDQDGDLDLAVGDFRAETGSSMTIWWNATPQRGAKNTVDKRTRARP